MIRQYAECDIDTLMQIWLDTNIQAHNFISPDYWRNNFDMVRKMLYKGFTIKDIEYFSGITYNQIYYGIIPNIIKPMNRVPSTLFSALLEHAK